MFELKPVLYPELILEGNLLLWGLMWSVFFLLSSSDPSNELPSEKLMLTLHDSLAAHNFKVFGFIQSGLLLPITFIRLSFPSLQWRPCDLFLHLTSSNYFPPLLFFIHLYLLWSSRCIYVWIQQLFVFNASVQYWSWFLSGMIVRL